MADPSEHSKDRTLAHVDTFELEDQTASSSAAPLRASQQYWGLTPFVPPPVGPREKRMTLTSITGIKTGKSSHGRVSNQQTPVEDNDSGKGKKAAAISEAQRTPELAALSRGTVDPDPMHLQDVKEELQTRTVRRSCWEQVKQKLGAKM